MSEETPKTEQLVNFIRSYTQQHGYAPSTREMAEALGFKSVESVHRLLLRLRLDERVTWEPRKARTLRVVE